MPSHAHQVSDKTKVAVVKVATTFLATAAAFMYGCANASAPPGGPPDIEPPVVVSITPASGSTDILPKEVELRFNEVVSETPQGAQELAALVFISPRSGDPRVSWGRNRITIRPRNGFKDSTVYTVELRPGLMDLRSNALDSAIRIVFSTGGDIPNTKVSGAVFDWVAGKPAAKALVEAIAPDSTTYQTLADSVGRFSIQHLPATRFVIRAIIDRNNNRELERLEPWDTVGLVVTEDASTDLYVFQHDTLPVRIQSIAYIDSLAQLRVVFDKPFKPGFVPEPSMFTLMNKDSLPLQVNGVVTIVERQLQDSIARVAREDSTARANRDTTEEGRARADSVEKKRVADSLTAVARLEEERRREALFRRDRPVARVDTVPPPKMNRPVPFSELFLILAEPLTEEASYILKAERLQSLSGVETPTPLRGFTVPKRPPARTDTTGRRR